MGFGIALLLSRGRFKGKVEVGAKVGVELEWVGVGASKTHSFKKFGVLDWAVGVFKYASALRYG